MKSTKKHVLVRHFTIILVISAIVAGCSQNSESEESQISRTEYALGTYISVRAYGKADDELLSQVFSRVKEIEEKMSVSREDYDDTELLDLNRRAGEEAYQVSPDTYKVLEAAKGYSELTDGAFDLSIGPLVSLWNIGSEDASVPPEEENRER